MATNTSDGSDSGKLIVPFTLNVLNTMQNYGPQIYSAANAANVSPLSNAGPIAREMNKFDNGDYSYWGFGTFWQNAIKDELVTRGGPAIHNFSSPLTQDNYMTSLILSIALKASNKASSGFSGYANRVLFPTMNDVGPAKFQIGTAMKAVSFYSKHPEAFSGTDPLDLNKYLGNTPTLVKDLLDPN